MLRPSFWFQTHAASPIRNTVSATVLMSCTTRLLRAARRIANRSTSIPARGAMTSTTTTRAGIWGIPKPCVSCQ